MTPRAAEILSTRVDISRVPKNQRNPEWIDGRLEARLALQHTVEALSAAAITCLVLGHVIYAATSLNAPGRHVIVEPVMALSIPGVAAATIAGFRTFARSTRARRNEEVRWRDATAGSSGPDSTPCARPPHLAEPRIALKIRPPLRGQPVPKRRFWRPSQAFGPERPLQPLQSTSHQHTRKSGP